MYNELTIVLSINTIRPSRKIVIFILVGARLVKDSVVGCEHVRELHQKLLNVSFAEIWVPLLRTVIASFICSWVRCNGDKFKSVPELFFPLH